MPLDDDGAIHTSDESEYTEDPEYLTDDDDDDYEVEGGQIAEGEEEQIETEGDEEDIINIVQPGGGVRQTSSASQLARNAEAKPWTAFTSMPSKTRDSIERAINRLSRGGKQELTILLIGKNGAGKSSTGNALLHEAVFSAAPFQQDAGRIVSVSRRHNKFTLRIIDTPGLADGDRVNQRAVVQIQEEASRTAIDVVLYMDRLDLYRVEPADDEAMEAITRALGPDVWQHTILCLTRATVPSPPEGYDYDSFTQQRVKKLQEAVRRAGGPAELPYALIENSSKCHRDADGEKAPLPNKVAWRPLLWDQVADRAAANSAFRADEEQAARKANPNKRHRWWIPVALAVQVAFKLFVFDRLVEDDGVRGDEHGPFDPLTVKEERQRLADEKAARAALKSKAKEDSDRARIAAFSGSAVEPSESDDEDSDEDEEDQSDGSSSDSHQ